jgi:uncharacterized protein YyaL (SSP411 family)
MDRGTIWSVLGAGGALLRWDQEREPRDDPKSWDSPMAEAEAFLISALTSLQDVSGESSCDPHAERILASVSGKMVEALSALDYLSVSRWIRSGSTAIGAETIPIMRHGKNRMTQCRRAAPGRAVPWGDQAASAPHISKDIK